MSLYVETRGEGQVDTQEIVFLHGWGFNSAVWHKVADDLAKTHRVTLVDLPGFGRSVNEKCHYDIDSLVELLVEVIPENAILVGWSMGGLISQAITLKYPQKIKKLILLGSNVQFMATDNWPNAMQAKVLDGFIGELVNNFKRTLQVFLMFQD